MTSIYVGPVEHLKGKTALVRVDDRRAGRVLAQFDDVNLTRSGKPLQQAETVLGYDPHARFPSTRRRLPATPPEDALGYGWHLFDAKDFQ